MIRRATLLALALAAGAAAPAAARQAGDGPAPCGEVGPAPGSPPLVAAAALVAAAERCGSRTPFERALDLLDPLLFRRDAGAEAWYLAGRAKLGLAELEAVPRWRDHQRPGTTYAQGARRALGEALRRDPAHARAASLLAELRTRTRGSAGSAADLIAIRAAAPTAAAADTAYWIRRARSELEWDEPDSALVAAERFAAAGGDAATAEWLRTRAFFALGRVADGAIAWFGGLDRARGAAVAAYRADLAWVARDTELAAFDSLPPGLRLDWARGFWQRRAVADFRTVPERLAEHFTRISQAVDAFRLTDPDRDYNSAMPYRSEQHLVDDRGVIWVRHGPPDEVLESSVDEGPGCGYVSWVYRHGTDAGMSVHFRSWFALAAYRSNYQFCSGRRDFRLVPGGTWIDDHAWWMAERDSLYARWADATRACRRTTAGRIERELVAEEAARLQLAVTTDGQPHRFAHDLGAVVRAYGLGRPGRLLVAFGVPATRLEAIPRGPDGRPVFALQLRLAALPARGLPVTLDTTILYDATRALRPDHWVLGQLEVAVPPGAWELRSLVTDHRPDAGTTGWQEGLEVPAPAGPAITALVLGTPRSELVWSSPAGPFPLSPLNSYARDEDVALFLEAAGLGVGEVEVRVRVHAAGRPDRAVLELRSREAPGADGRLALLREMDLARLAPGRYEVVVSVTPAAGEAQRRAQQFVVRR